MRAFLVACFWLGVAVGLELGRGVAETRASGAVLLSNAWAEEDLCAAVSAAAVSAGDAEGDWYADESER